MTLLSPSFWLAALLAIIGTFTGGYIKGHSDASASDIAKYAALRRSSEIAAQLLSDQRTLAAKEATDAYIRSKNRQIASADSARTELDRLRSILASREQAASSSQAASGVDGAGNAERVLLSECADALTRMGAEAGRLSGKVTGLQELVGRAYFLDPAPPQ